MIIVTAKSTNHSQPEFKCARATDELKTLIARGLPAVARLLKGKHIAATCHTGGGQHKDLRNSDMPEALSTPYNERAT